MHLPALRLPSVRLAVVPRLAVRTFFAAAFAAGVFFAPASAARAEGGQAEGSVLRVIAHADLRTLDPIWTTAYIARNHGYMVYDTLFAFDDAWQVRPQMVESFRASPDRLVWRFRLREGLLWHDGTPVTAADCVASLKRWWQRDTLGQQLRDAALSLEAEGARDFTLRLQRPFGPLPDALAKISSNVPFMMPARLAAASADEPVKEAVGSGPYRFLAKEWVPGVMAAYERFEGYRPRPEPAANAAGGKRAAFARIEWHYVPDANTALAGLRAGEFDLWEQAPADLADAMAAEAGLEVAVADPLGYQGMLRFNHVQLPFSDPRLRRAALLAVDQERFLAAAAGPPRFWRPCRSYFPCGTPYASEAGLEGARYDLEAARAAVAAAEYDGAPVVLLQPSDIPVLSAFAEVAAEQLRKAGFVVELEAMDWAALAQRRASRASAEEGGWSLFPTAWVGADVLDPSLAAALNASGEGAWFGWPQDEALEAARARFLAAGSEAERKAAAEEVQRRAVEVATHANLGSYFLPMAWRRAALAPPPADPVPFFWRMTPPE